MKNYWLDRKNMREAEAFWSEFESLMKLKKAWREGTLLTRYGKKSKWDFESALRGTIKDKYETEHIKVIEITNVCARKPNDPPWLYDTIPWDVCFKAFWDCEHCGAKQLEDHSLTCEVMLKRYAAITTKSGGNSGEESLSLE